MASAEEEDDENVDGDDARCSGTASHLGLSVLAICVGHNNR